MFGTSFGGGHVIQLAARDKRIAAVISQCPFTSGFHSSLTLGVVTTLKMVPLALADFVGSFFSDNAFRVNLAGSRGQAALMNAPDCVDGYYALVPKDAENIDTVAARIALQIPFLAPGAHAKNVQVPLYVSVCKNDT